MLTISAIAQGLAVDRKVVRGYIKRGCPTDSVEAAAAWKAANVRARVVAKKVAKRSNRGRGAPPAPVSLYQDARTRWAIAEANERELSVLERKAVLVHRDKVRAELARQLAGLRNAILQIPSRLQSVLAAETDEAKVHDLLQDELYAVLGQIAEAA